MVNGLLAQQQPAPCLRHAFQPFSSKSRCSFAAVNGSRKPWVGVSASVGWRSQQPVSQHSRHHHTCRQAGLRHRHHSRPVVAQAAGAAAGSDPPADSPFRSRDDPPADSPFRSRDDPPADSPFRSTYDAEILALAVPALFSVLLDPLLGLVDTALVGRLGTASLAAVGLATLVFNFSSFLFSFLMVVTTPRVAAAMANDNREEASRVTAQGLQVAWVLGVVVFAALWCGAPRLAVAMGAKGDVIKPAIEYLRCRSIASPAILSLYVAIGTFRGNRDTVTPLFAAIAANLINLTLDLVLIFVFGMGVAGAALATSVSQYVSVIVLVGMLLRRRMLLPADLLSLPGKSELSMFLKAGVSLSSRNIISMVVILYATRIVSNLGPASLAAHEILRQVWIFSIQAFSALDIATQTLVATYLGQRIQSRAYGVLKRTLLLGTVAGVVIGIAMVAGARLLPMAFTSDATVIRIASGVFPVLAMYLPFDACASIMDGSLLGAGDTGYLGTTMVVTGLSAFTALHYGQKYYPGLLSLWLGIKCLTLGRVLFGALRLRSKDTPLAVKRTTEA